MIEPIYFYPLCYKYIYLIVPTIVNMMKAVRDSTQPCSCYLCSNELYAVIVNIINQMTGYTYLPYHLRVNIRCYGSSAIASIGEDYDEDTSTYTLDLDDCVLRLFNGSCQPPTFRSCVRSGILLPQMTGSAKTEEIRKRRR